MGSRGLAGVQTPCNELPNLKAIEDCMRGSSEELDYTL